MQAEGRAPLSGDEPGASTAADTPSDPTDQVPVAGQPAGTDDPGVGSRRPQVPLLLAVAVTVVALDQLSKALVVALLADHEPIRLLGGLLTLDYTRNPGAAFSLGTGFTFVFTAVALAVVVVILRTSRRLYSKAWAVALGGLLGGAVGNLVDRLTRDPGFGRGHVVDWIELPHWPVFNLADAAICCAAVGMILLSFLGRDLDGTRHGSRA
jgi:signal peptidase II